MLKRRPILLLALLLGLLPPSVRAQSDESCLTCHEDKDLKSEKGLPVFVDGQKTKASVHGQAGLSCVDCHADLGGVSDFPHASPLRKVGCGGCHEEAAKEFAASVHAEGNNTGASAVSVSCKDCHGTHEIRRGDDFDALTFALNLPATCETCHLERVKTARGTDFIRGYRESAHFKALEKSGLTMSANCGNCHGSHGIKSVDDPLSRVSRKNIIATCGGCHVGIQRDYLEGVHGKDYVKGIKDVPVCTDCHSEHNIVSPEDLESRVYATKVAGVCSRCHDDLSLSRRYGFLTSRLKTYSESFHGTAARFGETRVANCASCPGPAASATPAPAAILPRVRFMVCPRKRPGPGTGPRPSSRTSTSSSSLSSSGS